MNSTVADLLFAVESEQAHLGISAISMTAARDKHFDWSYPIFEGSVAKTGLRGCLKSRLSSKKAHERVSCEYELHSTERATLVKAYPSNLIQDQYELLSDMIPEPKSGGRPREVDLWEVINAIFYVLCSGCRVACQTL